MKESMNILNIMLGRGKGGIEQAALDYARGLRGAGAEVLSVLSPNASVLPAAQSHEIPYVALKNLGAWDRLSAWRLRRIARHYGADVVIAHGNRALCLAHNYQLKHFSKADAAFCITHQAMEAVEAAHPSLQGACYFIPNMIAAVDAPARSAIASPPRIGAMGRMVAKKGFDVWLRALALLKERGVPFHATLAGEGEEKARLLALRDALGLHAHVTFAGWVESIDAFYAEMDVFCVPSHHEPFGIVMLEAMVRGLPVVSTANEGACEILADSQHGILTPLNDAYAMADALVYVLSDAEGMIHMGARARAHALETYSMKQRSADMVIALKRIVA
jgi:glycosyltransferase involved in cell wall biosynthesis